MRRFLGLVAFVVGALLLISCGAYPRVDAVYSGVAAQDNLTINVFTTAPPKAYRVHGGQLNSVQFVPRERSSGKRGLPEFVTPKYPVEDWLQIPGTGMYAVLTKGEHWGLRPDELVAMVASHPIPYNTLYVELFTSTGDRAGEYKCITGRYLSATLYLAL